MAHIRSVYKLDKYKKEIHLPEKSSHKGQNGRLLVIGGSHIFHAASIWSAEVASRFVDLVHYCSTKENNEIFVNLKSKFTNGIVIPREQLLSYVEEDDCILIGPGMERGIIPMGFKNRLVSFESILTLHDEASYTYSLLHYLLKNYPEKRFVLDAAALRMLDTEVLLQHRLNVILTPHAKEFQSLFDISLDHLDDSEICNIVQTTAKKYSCVIMLKRTIDFISDGSETIQVIGGNEGLSKGGTGDALAGLTAAFYTKSSPVASCVLASYIVKSTAESLFHQTGTFYNTSDLIASIPSEASSALY